MRSDAADNTAVRGDAAMSRALAKSAPGANRSQNTALTRRAESLDPPAAAISGLDGSASSFAASSSGVIFQPAYPPPAFPDAADDLSGCIMIAHFPDAFAVWLRDPMPKAEATAALAPLCGGKPQIENRKARFDPAYRQRILLRQPSREAIEYLDQRNDVLFNYQELAQDLIYHTDEESKAAYQFYIAHVLKKDRRGQSFKVCLGEDGHTTAYSDQRKAKSVSLAYTTHSKATGDPALHIEDRSKGPRMLKRKGSGSLKDLLSLEHLQFWQDHSQFWCITDYEGLGRAYLNLSAKEKDPKAKAARKPRIIRIGNTTYNEDKRMGHQLERVLGLFSDDQITIPKPKAKAASKAKVKSEYPGFWSIYAACSIQNVYDRLNHLVPLYPFMSRIDALGSNRHQSANSEIARSMRGPANPPHKETKQMSNRYGYDPLDQPERHISRYQRRKSNLEGKQELAKEAAAQAKKKPAIDIAKPKRKLASKPTERAERKGGPLPSDFHWGHYPDEE
jgi:hypothetical protein